MTVGRVRNDRQIGRVAQVVIQTKRASLAVGPIIYVSWWTTDRRRDVAALDKEGERVRRRQARPGGEQGVPAVFKVAFGSGRRS